MSYDGRPRVCEQVRQLQDPVDRLWWFAQLERGIEVADIDREPRFGSRAVLRRLVEVYEPASEDEYFTPQWEPAELNIGGRSHPLKSVEVTR